MLTRTDDTLMQTHNEWARRPADECFVSLLDMQQHFARVRNESYASVVANRRLEFEPVDLKGLKINVNANGDCGGTFDTTHWSFGQVAQLAQAPAGYLRTLPAPLVADNLNYGLRFNRDVEDIGILIQRNGKHVLRAATGPRYGRIWNADIVNQLVDRFGDGVSGTWRVPGEFGKRVAITKDNTTLYASDRDMFVFLCDEENRIEIADRRNGKPGSLARGFFMWNSEVGDKTFGIGTFLFDYVCQNRIVWGASEYKEVTIRHTAGAPDRFLEEIRPTLMALRNASAEPLQQAIEQARKTRVEGELDDFLAKRFGKRMVTPLTAIHEAEEGRPIESLWDVSTAVTAYARGIEHADQRVALEREAGKLLKAVA